MDNSDDQCSVCYSKFDQHQHIPMLVCINQHNVCQLCVFNVKNKCPLCKRPFDPKEISLNRILVNQIKEKNKKESKDLDLTLTIATMMKQMQFQNKEIEKLKINNNFRSNLPKYKQTGNQQKVKQLFQQYQNLCLLCVRKTIKPNISFHQICHNCNGYGIIAGDTEKKKSFWGGYVYQCSLCKEWSNQAMNPCTQCSGRGSL